MKYRLIESSDVETIRGFYEKFPEFPKPVRDALPNNGMDGWCIEVDGKVVAATYAFLASNCPYAWMEWTVADKDWKSEQKHELVSGLIEYACKQLRDCGYKYVFAFSTEEQKLIPLYEAAGFVVNETPAHELIKIL